MSGNEKKSTSLILRFFSGMRLPWVFAATALLFAIDLAVPDLFPFVDELLLGMLTLLLAAWRKRKDQRADNGAIIDAKKPALAVPEREGDGA